MVEGVAVNEALQKRALCRKRNAVSFGNVCVFANSKYQNLERNFSTHQASWKNSFAHQDHSARASGS